MDGSDLVPPQKVVVTGRNAEQDSVGFWSSWSKSEGLQVSQSETKKRNRKSENKWNNRLTEIEWFGILKKFASEQPVRAVRRCTLPINGAEIRGHAA
jgi:hypothetical protein